MMNPEIKAQWVAALRSGTFEQGYGNLAYDGNYCCLGVLCELAVSAGIVTKEMKLPVTGLREYDGHESSLPDSVIEWAGLHDRNPIVLTSGRAYRLTSLNDTYKFTFPEIANTIESSDI